jgi:hypothetical protein
MTTHNDEDRMERLLKQSLPPTEAQPRAKLQRDLWPAMLQRLGETSSAVPWFDWALLVAVVVWLAIFPRAIPVLLYHL